MTTRIRIDAGKHLIQVHSTQANLSSLLITFKSGNMMNKSLIICLFLVGCGNNNDPAILAAESEKLSQQSAEQEAAAVIEKDRKAKLALENSRREEEIRQEQARIDGIRRANELDAMERQVAVNKEVQRAYTSYISGDLRAVTECDSAVYAGLLLKLGVERLPNHPDSCTNIGSNGASINSCPPCQ